MGLLKTAIMTGGGIYAVDKIAKASLSRNDNQVQQQHTCQRCGYTNGSTQNWEPARSGPQNDYPYPGYQDQRRFNSSPGNQPNFDDQRDQREFLPGNSQRAGISPADFDDGKRYVQNPTPPPYNQQK